jgi:microcystin-dependent protein
MSTALPLGTIYNNGDPNFNPNTTSNNLFVGVWVKHNEMWIRTDNKISVLNTVLMSIYPVGIILEFKNNTDPNMLWPETHWEKIEEKFLFASSDSPISNEHFVGNTGGSKTVTLSTAHIPIHNHSVSVTSSGTVVIAASGSHNHSLNTTTFNAAAGTHTRVTGSGTEMATNSTTHTHTVPNHTHTISQSNVGSGAAHDNMPPFLVVEMWYRRN